MRTRRPTETRLLALIAGEGDHEDLLFVVRSYCGFRNGVIKRRLGDMNKRRRWRWSKPRDKALTKLARISIAYDRIYFAAKEAAESQ